MRITYIIMKWPCEQHCTKLNIDKTYVDQPKDQQETNHTLCEHTWLF